MAAIDSRLKNESRVDQRSNLRFEQLDAQVALFRRRRSW
jgi:hypothetical protein